MKLIGLMRVLIISFTQMIYLHLAEILSVIATLLKFQEESCKTMLGTCLIKSGTIFPVFGSRSDASCQMNVLIIESMITGVLCSFFAWPKWWQLSQCDSSFKRNHMKQSMCTCLTGTDTMFHGVFGSWIQASDQIIVLIFHALEHNILVPDQSHVSYLNVMKVSKGITQNKVWIHVYHFLPMKCFLSLVLTLRPQIRWMLWFFVLWSQEFHAPN